MWSTRCGSFDWMQCLSEISARCQTGLRRRLARRWGNYHFEIIVHEGFSTSIWTTTSTSTWTKTLFGKEVLRLSLSDYCAGGTQTSTPTPTSRSLAASQVSEKITSILSCWRTFIEHEVKRCLWQKNDLSCVASFYKLKYLIATFQYPNTYVIALSLNDS